VIVGVWALFAPKSFYSNFPLPGHPWVSLLPPYNEHLVRDVGELSLALTVVLVAAAVTGQWLLSAVAVAATAVYAVPHAIFHFLHLEGFPTSDAVAQTIGIALQLVVTTVVGLLLWRDRSSAQPDPKRPQV
jgi:heme/copper-type cytochrome/quinol oxidase subunit 4